MAKQPKIDHVKFVKAKGKRYVYFNTGQKVDGKPVYKRLPDLSDPSFWPSYGRMVGWRTQREEAEYTVAHLAAEYRKSADYLGTSAGTRESYGYSLDKIDRLLGKYPVNQLEHSDIQLILDGEGWGAATANSFVAVIGTIYRWGRERGKARIKPADDFKRLRTGEYAPWPEHVLEAALRADDATVRLATHLLYFTGQRMSDVLRMTWADVDRGRVRLHQKKTGKPVNFRLPDELKAELDRTPRAGITIMNRQANKSSAQTVRKMLQAFATEHGVKIVPHGLRKNAVNSLLLSGCTIAETAAITGQSYAVVEHYAKQIDHITLGDAAVSKLDDARRNKSA